MTTFAGVAVHLASLLAASAAHHISSTPPRVAQQSSDHLLRPQDERKDRVPPGGKETLHGHRLFNRVGMICVAATKYVVWALIALEVIARLLSQFPDTAISRAILPIILPTPVPEFTILPVPGPPRPQKLLLSAPSPTVFISLLSISVGYVIRRACFAAMGRLFSFTHTTLAGHQLVKGGPYNIVRHPSYTGEVLVRFGMVALLLAPGGFVLTCGALQQHSTGLFGASDLPQRILLASVRCGVAFFVGWVSFACTYLILRAPSEDATLRETFGKEWEEYAKAVPYRFVPHIA
ncbi:uncharacterized protein FOMMEDRAFT_149567 [Fomitiporia mediterranea MF3/22]|uniref:Protein-S-isoprenylcysteine O-methyltransferase n=1 Tax=Fomitiporia mediterranea (strain MF3/22) TaxID=694068 RepID=R7SGD3_FOMME|nr:uncharacterized protein FOMMEDRAFT_149567 [Fomitiporia mediterranea MF3/22]EJC97761.1 hypothetical protein FOMMEDRAFT_149567 [Fomitiporia mediterranea MF3/22]